MKRFGYAVLTDITLTGGGEVGDCAEITVAGGMDAETSTAPH